jgi:hypothetical protein
MHKRVIVISTGLIALTLFTSVPVFAASNNPAAGTLNKGARLLSQPTVMGTVASINGTAIVLTGKNGISYTVDASKATLTKAKKSPITITDIKAGDTLRVFGVVSGTNVVATKIIAGAFVRANHPVGAKDIKTPGMSGKVTAISGTTITLTTKNSKVYTVDATNAVIIKSPKTTIKVSDIVVGDSLRVTGAITGNNVVATKIYDGLMKSRAQEKKPGLRKHYGAKKPVTSSSTTLK